MVSQRIKRVKLSSLSKKRLFCFRYCLRNSALQDSVKHMGILMPLFVTNGIRPEIIAGSRRVAAATALKIQTVPVIEFGIMKPKEAFLLSLISNWHQNFSEMDRACAIVRASQEFQFEKEDMQHVILPLLGLSNNPHSLALYTNAHTFPNVLKDLFENQSLSFRSAPMLVRFSRKDQEYFARAIATPIRLTTSQAVQICEWLLDLMRGSGKDLATLVQRHGILKVLGHRSMDPRTKADKFYGALKRVRFPQYSARLDSFEKQCTKIGQGIKNLRLEPIEGFEEHGFELHARVKNPENLQKILKRLSEKLPALHSLFDVKL